MMVMLRALKGWSVRKMAAELGVAMHRVQCPLTLMRLPPTVIEMVRRGELAPSHAFEIEKAPAEKQLEIARAVLRQGLSFDETVELIGDHRIAASDPPRVKRQRTSFPFPGGYEVVVISPPGASWSSIRKMLLDVVILLEGA